MSEGSAALTSELLDLMEHEKAIEQHLDGIGWHLERIRDEQKYRAAGFATFEDYCRDRWHKSRHWAYQLIAAAQVVAELSATADTRASEPSPISEWQVRPLTALRDDPDALRAAWDNAVGAAGGDQPTASEVAEAVERVKSGPPTKPDLGGGVSHPARFSDALFPVFGELLDGFRVVLDPFAGTGRIHELGTAWETTGIEIEPEWAAMHERTWVGDALDLFFDDSTFDAICTSPTYGNRLADHHDASDPETRRSYTHDLGRDLHPENSGALQWGNEYRDFHERAWAEAVRVLRPGGRFVLNVKDHIRGGQRQAVTGWHVGCLNRLGLVVADVIAVPTSSMGAGANREARVAAEFVIAMDAA